MASDVLVSLGGRSRSLHHAPRRKCVDAEPTGGRKLLPNGGHLVSTRNVCNGIVSRQAALEVVVPTSGQSAIGPIAVIRLVHPADQGLGSEIFQ